MKAKLIGLAEVIAALECTGAGRLTAMWTVAAAVRCSVHKDGRDWVDSDKAAALCDALDCGHGWAAVMRHVDSIPAGERGLVRDLPTVYANGQPAACPPIEAQEAIAQEIADGAAMGSVEVGGVTYSWD